MTLKIKLFFQCQKLHIFFDKEDVFDMAKDQNQGLYFVSFSVCVFIQFTIFGQYLILFKQE